jgi:biopolymer transport protein ExbD
MNKIDTTKYLRQMKYLPNLTPLSNILMIIALIIFPGALGNWSFLPALEEQPEIKYANYERSDNSFVSVVIKKTGKIRLFDRDLENLSKLNDLLAEKMEELQTKRLRIFADADAPWGKIVDVLQAAKEAGVNPVGFMMAREHSILHYWDTKNRYREKGLKYPEIAQ